VSDRYDARVTARRALVTGASSGIGAATARVLAAAGYRVAALARRAERLASLVSELPRSEGGEHLALPCDLTRPAELETAFARAGTSFGGLDLVVANAGIGYRARVEDLEADELRRVFATNVEAVLLGAKAALPHLARGLRPSFVIVSSVVGRRGMPTMAAYSASKAAACSIGEALRIEWRARGIAVSVLNPGVTATEIFERQKNPARLHDPELDVADPPERVAREILALDRAPREEVFLRWKWRWLGALSVAFPRVADRLLASRSWMPPSPPPAREGP
jgi:NAD(P)-dependent dehydrogenase (short-subunit alcohol dehydrogenase family)